MKALRSIALPAGLVAGVLVLACGSASAGKKPEDRKAAHPGHHAEHQTEGKADAHDKGKGVVKAEEVTGSEALPLAVATRGLRGKGTLQAKIEVESRQTGGALKGSFTCTLFEDKAPKTVANFVALARGLRPWKDLKEGKWVKRPLYDGTLFHRVIPQFMIQGGDPEGTGRGGPGYAFDDEISPDLTFDKPGMLAMANRGIDRTTGHGTNGSQFFITEVPTPWLNARHTIFGHCEPLDLVRKIARVPTAGQNRPVTDVVIKKVVISRGRR